MPHPSQNHLYDCFEKLERLEPEKITQLLRYAEDRALRVRTHVRYVDGGDLFQEAFLRTADGRRSIYEDSLYWHLRQTISSIANELARANWNKNFDLPIQPTAAQVKPAPEEERDIDTRRFAHELMSWFEAHDPEAAQVSTLISEDYKPREIQQELGLSEKDYGRIRKKISRHGKTRARRKGLY